MHVSRPSPGSAKRIAMYRREVAQRAAMFYRLGYSISDATGRVLANARWDFELGAPRPDELSDAALGDIVKTTYARRPAL